ncbi:hypothetical protein COTS27_00675 [Spirochaetota bacterium]|nr:hypothetical protein COTS27_00675 [Spirochaetota bacterium]
METRISGQELVNLKKEVTSFNAQLKQRQPRTGGEDLDKDAFLRLLTIQISRQDPLSPMKNTEFVAQMAQFTALEQMKNMNTSMTELKKDITVMPLFSMIGKEISYYDEAKEAYVTGNAEGVILDKQGEPMVVIDDKRIGLEHIVSVKEKKDLRSQLSAVNALPNESKLQNTASLPPSQGTKNSHLPHLPHSSHLLSRPSNTIPSATEEVTLAHKRYEANIKKLATVKENTEPK